MINIIIPAYNAHATIDRCIASILTQSYKDYNVTIVNDGGKSYSDVVSRYENVMKIREICHRDNANRGAGYSRQLGLDHTNGEFVMFMDADDVLYSPYALEQLYIGITCNPIFVVCSGRFIEETDDRTNVVLHQEDMVWVFGKLYKRDFIDKFNIRFCPNSRWNEDHGFNSAVKLCLNDNAQINFITDIVYSWTNQPHSITKDDTYAYGKSFVGNIENLLWAISIAKRNNICEEHINQFAIESLFSIYQYLLEAYSNDKRFLHQNWEWLQEYYNSAIRPIKHTITDDTISMFYSYTMERSYENGSMNGIVPFIGIYDFINKLDSKQTIDYDVDDQSSYFPIDSAWLVIK